MKQCLTPDTLAYQLGVRPAVQFRDMSLLPLTQVVQPMNEFFKLSNLYNWATKDGASISDPLVGHAEVDALIFYMLNHAVSLVRQRVHPLQPLGTYMPVIDLFHREMSVRAPRMFYYMLLICIREGRHEFNGPGMNALYAKHGYELKSFQHSFPDNASSAVSYFTKNCPQTITLGNFTTYLAAQFYKGGYGSSFGGKAWGKVADVLRDYVHGVITAEMMLDTSFTLAHNTGPIFNKGMLFHEQDNSMLQKILDVQRSGQIPQLIASNGVDKFTSNPRVQSIHKECRSILGSEFKGKVDWYKVEELGSEGKYTTEKASMGMKPKTGGAQSLGQLLKEKLKKDTVHFPDEDHGEIDKEDEIIPEYLKVFVYPGQFIVKAKSPRAKA